MTKKDDKEMTITGRTPRPLAIPYYDFNRNGRVRELVVGPPIIAADYRQLEERAAAQLLEDFKQAFPEIADYMKEMQSMNADVKGALGQECARGACSNEDARWFNKSTRKFYCGKCAGRINLHNPGLCVMAAGLTDAQLEALKI